MREPSTLLNMSSLVSIAESLLAQARKIEHILEVNSVPYTSLDRDTLELLPENAQKYVEYIEKFVGVKIKYIGTGPGRESMIVR